MSFISSHNDDAHTETVDKKRQVNERRLVWDFLGIPYFATKLNHMPCKDDWEWSLTQLNENGQLRKEKGYSSVLIPF